MRFMVGGTREPRTRRTERSADDWRTGDYMNAGQECKGSPTSCIRVLDRCAIASVEIVQ